MSAAGKNINPVAGLKPKEGLQLALHRSRKKYQPSRGIKTNASILAGYSVSAGKNINPVAGLKLRTRWRR